jgi:hypothetical protein
MKTLNIKKVVGVTALGLVALLGVSESANAQGRGNQSRIDRQIERQDDRIEKQQNKLELERLKLERERLQNARSNVNNNRFRVNRNGRWYNMDRRGADLLRQAVNAGYQQGLQAGRADRNGRRSLNWRNSSVYRSATYGYQSHVDRSLYQHYFQQGFERGYRDGYNSRLQYGHNSGGSVNILGTILNSLLNIQQY